MKQMFDISEKLISEQDEIYRVNTIKWDDSSWKHLSLIGNEEILNLQRTKVYLFSDPVLCLGKIHENPPTNIAWRERLEWFKSSPEYRTLDRIDGDSMEFEWNFFTGFNTLQLSQEVKSLLLRLGETPENFTGRIVFMSMFIDISHGSKDNEKEYESSAQLVSLFAKRFESGRWPFLGLGSEKKWYSISADSPQGEWDRIAELMMIKFGESGHPVFRATSSLSRGTLQSKGGEKLSIHFCADGGTIETVFRTIISVNQLSLYGAVDVQWHLLWSKDKKECDSNARLVSLFAGRFGAGQWSFLGLGSEKNVILSVKIVHKVNGTKWRKRWWWHSQKADTQSFEPRVHCPEVS